MAETALNGPETGPDDHANHNGFSVSPDHEEYHGHSKNHPDPQHLEDHYNHREDYHQRDDHHDGHEVHHHDREDRHHDRRDHGFNSGHDSLIRGTFSEPIGPQARYLNSNPGRISNFYVNGDKFFPGKKIVHNPKYFKDMPHYLDYLTDKLEPRFGAVRKICTPKHGSRVLSLQDIHANCDYVVVGAERFKPFQ
ncbi:doublecortin domain-containing protein 2 [Plakobranchus ocellatus]|uniref:Doublecortin domain-containing protein 2 n=1 Tax=Plakobranchus ocellatus TaxID=259542 RepID=A0AAV4D086_9GAST|nr:doublecortin domain-containing protein 2 [Plakobranchus ocellatus]